MRVMSRAKVGAFFVAAALAASTASASPREAQEQFEAGRALVKAGKPNEAIPKFLVSIAAEPTLAALLNLADCYERVGKLASARARFRQAQELAKDKDPLRADEARKRAELLDPRVSTITLLPPPRVEGAHVWVDGVEVPSSQWGAPYPYDAGSHEIITQDARGKRKTASIDVPVSAARLTFPIEIDGEPAVAASPAVPPQRDRAIDQPPATHPDRTMRTVGIVVGAVGVVAVGVGAVTGIVALGASSDLKGACASYPQCPADKRTELVDLDDRARSFGTISTITLISGAALVAVGTVLFLMAPSTASTSSTSAAMGARRARALPFYAGGPVAAW